MTAPDPVAAAELRVASARDRLSGTVATLQARLDPQTVARNTISQVAEGGERALRSGIETARANPGKVAGAVAIVAAFLARRRIAALIRRPDTTDPHTIDTDDAAQPATVRRVRARRPRPAPARRDST